MRRYPFANLCEALHVTPTDLKRRLGLDHRQLSRYLEQGLPEARADELAVRLGLVAANVWPEMIDHAIEDASVECAERSCSETFVPSRSGQRYCSRRCGNRVRARERQAKLREDPAYREAERLRRRRYFEESRDAEYRVAAIKWRTDPEYRRKKQEARRRWREDPANRRREYEQTRAKYEDGKKRQQAEANKMVIDRKDLHQKQDSDRSKIEQITASTGTSQGCTPTRSQVERDSVAA